MDKQAIYPEGHWRTPWPSVASQGWRIGELVFVGGQISMDENGQVVGVGDFDTQLRNVMENIRSVLAEAGAEMNDVVKVNAFVVHKGGDETLWEFWEHQGKLRASYFESPGPIMTGIPVPRLGHPDLLVEIEALAVIRSQNE